MAFRVPTFSLSCFLWHTGGDVSLPPDLTVACNLMMGGHPNPPVEPTPGATSLGIALAFARVMSLCLPKGTDVRPAFLTSTGDFDCVEVPGGSGRYYAVLGVDDVGKGFPNEYRLAAIVPFTSPIISSSLNTCGVSNPWPTPIP
jgi:hypothetical protein